MEDQELMFKLSMFEQQINGIYQQLQAIEKAILDMQTLNLGLEDMKGKTGEEIFAPVGRGIFVRAKLLSEELTVDVGGKNFVKKDIDSTNEIINGQISKLNEAKESLEKSLEEINRQLNQVMLESQNKKE